MNKFNFIQHIKAASKKIDCDLVIKNISIIDVFMQDTYVNDVAIKDGYIIGIGNYNGKIEIDGKNKYITPGFIDAHIHIESSLTTPYEYAKAALMHGVTTAIADPHEIANVLGTDGINFIIENSKNIPFDFYFMLPSCVPATYFENSGATLNSYDLKNFYLSPRILGLAEVMNFPAVSECDEDMIAKLLDARINKKRIDGHASGLTGDAINIYAAANIRTDHECISSSEAIEKLRRGMYILMREGTSAKNLKELLPIINEGNSRKICFCTDDKHIDDLIKNGSIDYSVRYAIKKGINPACALQIASLNAAECYKLDNLGAIAPGYRADFLILNNLEEVNIQQVYKNGKLVVDNNKVVIEEHQNTNFSPVNNSINIPPLNKDSFKINLKDKNFLNVMELTSNKLETNHLRINISNYTDTDFKSDINEDILKTAVIERHHNTGNIGLGLLKGINLKEGAIATTIAHDSHNLIICGTNDNDMIFAAESLKEMGGGIIIVKNNTILASVKLEIAGLITRRPVNELLADLEKLHSVINKIAPNINFNPFLTLSFISLPVIPDLKITDKGLFDVKNLKFIPVSE